MAPSTTTLITHSQVDDLYFSALSATEESVFPISDERYAEELQFQEVLASSLLVTTDGNNSNSGCTVRHQLHHDSRASSSTQISLLAAPSSSPLTVGEDSNSTTVCYYCQICAESKPRREMFESKRCQHLFCRECIGRHVAAKVGENILMVLCPDPNCRGVLEPDHCRWVIPEEVFNRWGDALCESTLLGSRKFYCPYKDCSALFLVGNNDTDGDDVAWEEEITQSECGKCRRLFCAKCGVPWHAGISCEEYQSLGSRERAREDLLLIELAKKKQWKRCPNCMLFVERVHGCLHMTCRCKFQFCYGCGEKWSERHQSCHT